MEEVLQLGDGSTAGSLSDQTALRRDGWSVGDDTTADKLVRQEAACWAVSHVNLALRLNHFEAVQNENPDCSMTKYPVMQRKTQPVCQACLADSRSITTHTDAHSPLD